MQISSECYNHRQPSTPFVLSSEIISGANTLLRFSQAPDGFQRFPVVVFLDGELFWRQRASRFPLKELSSEDLIAVSVSYRTNLFGKDAGDFRGGAGFES